jgi:hypothetical protein
MLVVNFELEKGQSFWVPERILRHFIMDWMGF